MKLQETEQGIVIEILVKPKSKRFHVKLEDDGLVVFCREAPVKGKVNRELTKELSRLFTRRVQILSGFTSRQKKLLIADINLEDFRDILSPHESEYAASLNETNMTRAHTRYMNEDEIL